MPRGRQFQKHLKAADAWIRHLAFKAVAPFERAEARRKQARYCGKLVAVTGSCGKSTTTYLTGELLGVEGAAAAIGMLHNTERDILRRMRKLDGPVDFVVQEVSGHRPGAIAQIAKVLRIDISIVTAVGLDHYTTFRKVEAVAEEKSTLPRMTEPDGVACLNADDPHVAAMASRTRARVVTFGTVPGAEVRAENARFEWPERLSFDLVIGDKRRPVRTRFVGGLMLTNILGALSVVHATGRDVDRAVAKLATIDPLYSRLGPAHGSDGRDYIVDVHKASLWSTRRMIEDLGHWGPVPRLLVLGDISDTGSDPQRKVRQLVQLAARNATFVVGTGTCAGPASRLAASQKLDHVVGAPDMASVRRYIDEHPDALVILKANATSHLERVLPPELAARPRTQLRRLVADS